MTGRASVADTTLETPRCRNVKEERMAGSFVIEKGSTGKYRFNLQAGNHEKILTSEAYETKAGAEGGIASARRNATDDARYARKTAKDGSPYFTLTATNGQVIGTSEMYSSTSAMEKGIASVKTNAPDAPVIDRS
jgi:uncharacterized protein